MKLFNYELKKSCLLLSLSMFYCQTFAMTVDPVEEHILDSSENCIQLRVSNQVGLTCGYHALKNCMLITNGLLPRNLSSASTHFRNLINSDFDKQLFGDANSPWKKFILDNRKTRDSLTFIKDLLYNEFILSFKGEKILSKDRPNANNNEIVSWGLRRNNMWVKFKFSDNSAEHRDFRRVIKDLLSDLSLRILANLNIDINKDATYLISRETILRSLSALASSKLNNIENYKYVYEALAANSNTAATYCEFKNITISLYNTTVRVNNYTFTADTLGEMLADDEIEALAKHVNRATFLRDDKVGYFCLDSSRLNDIMHLAAFDEVISDNNITMLLIHIRDHWFSGVIYKNNNRLNLILADSFNNHNRLNSHEVQSIRAQLLQMESRDYATVEDAEAESSEDRNYVTVEDDLEYDPFKHASTESVHQATIKDNKEECTVVSAEGEAIECGKSLMANNSLEILEKYVLNRYGNIMQLNVSKQDGPNCGYHALKNCIAIAKGLLPKNHKSITQYFRELDCISYDEKLFGTDTSPWKKFILDNRKKTSFLKSIKESLYDELTLSFKEKAIPIDLPKDNKNVIGKECIIFGCSGNVNPEYMIIKNLLGDLSQYILKNLNIDINKVSTYTISRETILRSLSELASSKLNSVENNKHIYEALAANNNLALTHCEFKDINISLDKTIAKVNEKIIALDKTDMLSDDEIRSLVKHVIEAEFTKKDKVGFFRLDLLTLDHDVNTKAFSKIVSENDIIMLMIHREDQHCFSGVIYKNNNRIYLIFTDSLNNFNQLCSPVAKSLLNRLLQLEGGINIGNHDRIDIDEKPIVSLPPLNILCEKDNYSKISSIIDDINNDDIAKNGLLLIGSSGVGKYTIGQVISKLTKRKLVSTRDYADAYNSMQSKQISKSIEPEESSEEDFSWADRLYEIDRNNTILFQAIEKAYKTQGILLIHHIEDYIDTKAFRKLLKIANLSESPFYIIATTCLGDSLDSNNRLFQLFTPIKIGLPSYDLRMKIIKYYGCNQTSELNGENAQHMSTATINLSSYDLKRIIDLAKILPENSPNINFVNKTSYVYDFKNRPISSTILSPLFCTTMPLVCWASGYWDGNFIKRLWFAIEKLKSEKASLKNVDPQNKEKALLFRKKIDSLDSIIDEQEVEINSTSISPQIPMPSQLKMRQLQLAPSGEKTFPVKFGDNGEFCIVDYLYNNSTVAKLIRLGSAINFSSQDQNKYNFISDNELRVDDLTVEIQGDLAFKEPVRTSYSKLTCNELKFLNRFLSKGTIDINANTCDIERFMKCKDILFEGDRLRLLHKSKLVAQQTATLCPKSSLVNDGTISCNDLSVDSQLVKLSKSSVVDAKTAKFRAYDTFVNCGYLELREALLAHSYYVINMGKIKSKYIHFKADLLFLNTIDILNLKYGDIFSENEIIVDALLLINAFGRISAYTIIGNAALNLNLLALYMAKNTNMSSIIDYNAGIYLPKFNRVSELATKENTYLVGSGLISKFLPTVGALLFVGKSALDMYKGNGLWQKGQQIYKDINDLIDKKNRCPSDWIAVIVRAKDLGLSSYQLGKIVVYQPYIAAKKKYDATKEKIKAINKEKMKASVEEPSSEISKAIRDKYGAKQSEIKDPSFSEVAGMAISDTIFGPSSQVNLDYLDLELCSASVDASDNSTVSSEEKTMSSSDKKSEKNFESTYKKFAKEHPNIDMSLQIASSVVSSVGPQISRDSVFSGNNKIGVIVGINGNSHSLFSYNQGTQIHANTSSINTVWGHNSGTIAAPQNNIFALQEYSVSSSSNIASVWGSIDTKSFKGEEGNNIYSLDQTVMKAESVDNHGTADNLALHFGGTIDKLKSIGKACHFQYSGTFAKDLPDAIVEGNSPLLSIRPEGSVTIIGDGKDNKDIHFKQEHDTPHSVRAISSEGRACADNPLKSNGSIVLSAKQVDCHTVNAKDIVELHGHERVTCHATITREGDDVNYKEISTPSSIKAGTVNVTSNGLAVFNGTQVQSGEGCTNVTAAKVVDLPAQTRSHIKTSTCEETKTTQRQTSTFVSDGKNSINSLSEAAEFYGTTFDAKKGTVINSPEGIKTPEVRDTTDRTTQFKADGWGLPYDESYTDTEALYKAGIHFKDPVAPEINCKVDVNFQCSVDCGEMKVNASGKKVEIKLGETGVEAKSHSTNKNILRTSEEVGYRKSGILSKPLTKLHTNADHVIVEDTADKQTEVVDTALSRPPKEEQKVEHRLVKENKQYTCESVVMPSKGVLLVATAAVAMATAGVGASAGAGLAASLGVKSTIASAIIANAASGAVNALIQQATISLLHCNGDIIAAAKSLVSTEAMKNMLISAASAGLTGGNNELLSKVGLPSVNAANNLGERILYAAPRHFSQGAIKTLADILSGANHNVDAVEPYEPESDKAKGPRKSGSNVKSAIFKNLRSSLASTIGSTCASEIGDLYGEGHINPIIHKVLHGALGSIEGFILRGDLEGALTGAASAIVVETVAELLSPKITPFEQIFSIEQELGRSLTNDEFMLNWGRGFDNYIHDSHSAGNLAKLLTLSLALLANGDGSVAQFTSDIAIDNNYLHLVMVGINAALTGYNLYKAYQSGGKDEFLRVLAWEAGLNLTILVGPKIAGKLYQFGSEYNLGTKTFATAESVIGFLLDRAPRLKVALGAIKENLALPVSKIKGVASTAGNAVKNSAAKVAGKVKSAGDSIAAKLDTTSIGKTLTEIEKKMLEFDVFIDQALDKAIDSAANTISKVIPKSSAENVILAVTPEGLQIPVRVAEEASSALNNVLKQEVSDISKAASSGAKTEAKILTDQAASSSTAGANVVLTPISSGAKRTTFGEFKGRPSSEIMSTINLEARQGMIDGLIRPNSDNIKGIGFIGEFHGIDTIHKSTGYMSLFTEMKLSKEQARQLLDHLAETRFTHTKLVKGSFGNPVVMPADNGSIRMFYPFQDKSLLQMRLEGCSGHIKIEINDRLCNIREKITILIG